MQKIEAYIRHEALEAIRSELYAIGLPSMSVVRRARLRPPGRHRRALPRGDGGAVPPAQAPARPRRRRRGRRDARSRSSSRTPAAARSATARSSSSRCGRGAHPHGRARRGRGGRARRGSHHGLSGAPRAALRAGRCRPAARAARDALRAPSTLLEQLCSCQRSLLQKALLTRRRNACPAPSPPQLPTGTWSIDPDSFFDRLWRQAPRRLDVPRRASSRRAGSIVTEDGAIRSIEGTVRVENLVTEEPAAHGSPAQRGLLRRRQAPRDHVQEHVDRAGRGRTGSASTATSRSAASRARSSSTPRSRASATARTATRALGITATGAIDRTDWGITWNAAARQRRASPWPSASP